MFRLQWFPWKLVIRKLARTYGFLDPVALLSQFNKFAQPSEVTAPLELIRAGMVFHARGLMNARTIQSNLDWIWPYWVERQFNPTDIAFIPRSFSLTQVNITNRNWTAVGLPDCSAFPIIDPNGLVTPFFDGWSIDAWGIAETGESLLPSKVQNPDQMLLYGENRLAVQTRVQASGLGISSIVDVVLRNGEPCCRIRFQAESDVPAVLAISLRPYNPEGVSFVHDVSAHAGGSRWRINGESCVQFEPPMDRHYASNYREGDVYPLIPHGRPRAGAACHVGMASAAACYTLTPRKPREIALEVPLKKDPQASDATIPEDRALPDWKTALEGHCRVRIPDDRMQFLYEAAVRTLILHSPAEVYAGPFYYKRFWFRDAAFILHALLNIGLHERAEQAIGDFIPKQSLTGYFQSQNGEWDSNGEVLWLLHRFYELTGTPLKDSWLRAAVRGARWIQRKRRPWSSDALHAGLLPAGFSAEHFGNNDYYYWDDYWGAAGLQAAGALCRQAGDPRQAEIFTRAADHLLLCIERSLLRSLNSRRIDGIPASPHRRMDAGAVGSVVVGYPLQLCGKHEPRLLRTLEFLLNNCFVDNAFFQDITHSGYNMYLSLHCAQCLLRAGDHRFFDIVRRVSELASPTGQWPEAIHPRTRGGCMGDGQHVWAAAEWVMMIKNMFVSEEEDGLTLIPGIPETWLSMGEPMALGPVHTRWGTLEVEVAPRRNEVEVSWAAHWREAPPGLKIHRPNANPLPWEAPQSETGTVRFSI